MSDSPSRGSPHERQRPDRHDRRRHDHGGHGLRAARARARRRPGDEQGRPLDAQHRPDRARGLDGPRAHRPRRLGRPRAAPREGASRDPPPHAADDSPGGRGSAGGGGPDRGRDRPVELHREVRRHRRQHRGLVRPQHGQRPRAQRPELEVDHLPRADAEPGGRRRRGPQRPREQHPRLLVTDPLHDRPRRHPQLHRGSPRRQHERAPAGERALLVEHHLPRPAARPARCRRPRTQHAGADHLDAARRVDGLLVVHHPVGRHRGVDRGPDGRQHEGAPGRKPPQLHQHALTIPSTSSTASGTTSAPATTVVATSATPLTVGTALTAEQQGNARTIIRVGRELGVGDRAIVVALAAAAQESSLRNIDWGDRDSVGLYQQRPSTGWGTVAQLTDPVHATKLFFGGRTNPNVGKTRGLLDVKGWSGMSLTAAAQAVQLSAHPTAYAKWEGPAASWLATLG
ncbi:hypothetical protein IFT45_07770 [Frigoribacterium sp. CFBP 13707]|nr:hypothetical protein [Frigoribacterium sp. CFBP 13707]